MAVKAAAKIAATAKIAAIYVRVSTEDQAKHGYSIENQIRECKKKAQTDNIRVYKDEGISGGILNRPQLSELRRHIKEGIIERVICYDVSRLSRDIIHQLTIANELERRSVKLDFVKEEYSNDPIGKAFFQMRGVMNELEKFQIAERTASGRREKARQGRVLRDFGIYGYNYDKETEQLVINEQEAETVRLIFNLFTEPNDLVKGINGIAKYLTNQGIPTKRGASIWHRQVVRQILMNTVYIGEFYQNRWNGEGMLGNKYKDPEERVPLQVRPKEEWIKLPCPAIIDEAQFNYVQKMLEESRRRWAGNSNHQYLLSGLVRCGECGNTMTGRRAKNWGKYVFEYTDVKNTAGAKNPGCGRKMKREELDAYVWDKVLSMLLNKTEEHTSNTPLEEAPSFEEAELARIEKELKDIDKRQQQLIKLFTQSSGNKRREEFIMQEMDDLDELRKRLENQRSLLDEQLSYQEDGINRQEQLEKAVDLFLTKKPEELIFEDRQKLLRYLVREVRVYQDKIQIYFF